MNRFTVFGRLDLVTLENHPDVGPMDKRALAFFGTFIVCTTIGGMNVVLGELGYLTVPVDRDIILGGTALSIVCAFLTGLWALTVRPERHS